MDPMSVVCPACDAPVGEPCVTKSGKPWAKFHSARTEAAGADPVFDVPTLPAGPLAVMGEVFDVTGNPADSLPVRDVWLAVARRLVAERRAEVRLPAFRALLVEAGFTVEGGSVLGVRR